jgi:peptidyl-dipeptidase Dcp
MPPFAKVKPEHFKPAFEESMKSHLDDLQKIVDSKDAPTFDSVALPLDRAGADYEKIAYLFGNLCGSYNTEDLQKVQMDMAPISARHGNAVSTYPGLFDKVDAVYSSRESSGLNSEQIRLVERLHLDMVRAGARFTAEDKKEYGDLMAQLAEKCTQFEQNVMKDESSYSITMTKNDLSGCPDTLIAAAKEAAKASGKAGDDEYVITLSRSLVEPFLTFSNRRDLREKAWRAWTKRGEIDPVNRNNKKIAEDILKLRQKQAQMHRCDSFGHYQCEDMMAKTPEKVMELLEKVWDKAKVSANNEREALLSYVQKESPEGAAVTDIEPWDWRYYAELVRKQKYNFDESALKPYLSLDAVTQALFEVSNKLYGLSYKERPDIQAYHSDVKVYEVSEKAADGSDKLVAIFLVDNYAREFKRSGAWMSEYRGQSKNLAPGEDPINMVPIISNNNNFAKGTPTLLSFDDAITLFHEAGHGHHGMLSDCTYKSLAGTRVLTDFVELPSQLMEHWVKQPEVQKNFKHFENGSDVPQDLLEKMHAARAFNQGFATIEYTSCALLDMAMHMQASYDNFDLSKFENDELERLGMPQGIVMRHRPTHFQHLFSGSHYAAGYYVYLWAEVLDADAFDAFLESGNIFSPEVASKARQYIYSAGNSQAPDELYRTFRGRDPVIEPMLKKKGLTV